MLRTKRPNRCKHCRERMPEDKARHVIHDECIDPWLAVQKEKKARAEERKRLAEAKVARAEKKRKAEEDKKIPELIKEADKAFMTFIRIRDQLAGHPCVSSGKPLDWSGNQTDAGHYRSRGAASHLRYNEDNCHAQSKYENCYLSGNIVQYRIRLIERIGLARVEALEANNDVHKWTADELRTIRDTYRAKAKALKEAA